MFEDFAEVSFKGLNGRLVIRFFVLSDYNMAYNSTGRSEGLRDFR
jgi:hypothetical protein